MKYQFHGVAKFLDKARTKLRGTDVLDAQNAQRACKAAENVLAEMVDKRDGQLNDKIVDALMQMRGEK